MLELPHLSGVALSTVLECTTVMNLDIHLSTKVNQKLIPSLSTAEVAKKLMRFLLCLEVSFLDIFRYLSNEFTLYSHDHYHMKTIYMYTPPPTHTH